MNPALAEKPNVLFLAVYIVPLDCRVPEKPRCSGIVRLTELLDLSMHPDDGVKFPSGPATCRSTFEFSPTDLTKPDSRVLLDLGGVEVPGG